MYFLASSPRWANIFHEEKRLEGGDRSRLHHLPLFYSNLLMGEFERSGIGQQRGLAWAIRDILTIANFEIAAISVFIGYTLFEFLRTRF